MDAPVSGRHPPQKTLDVQPFERFRFPSGKSRFVTWIGGDPVDTLQPQTSHLPHGAVGSASKPQRRVISSPPGGEEVAEGRR